SARPTRPCARCSSSPSWRSCLNTSRMPAAQPGASCDASWRKLETPGDARRRRRRFVAAKGVKPHKLRIGDALVQEGIPSTEQLGRALAEQKATGRMLGELLIEQNIITSASLVHVLAKCLGVKGCQLRHGLIDPVVVKL